MYKSVLVGTDGSETAAEAVRAATELAGALGATLHIVQVYKEGSSGSFKVPEMTMEIPEGVDPGSLAATQVESAAARARNTGVEVHTHVVSGDVVDQILAVAEANGIDLIVVGNKGMHGARRFLGSIPNAIAHSAQCAVLIANTT